MQWEPGSAANLHSYLETLQQAESKSRAQEWADAAALWEKVANTNPVVGAYWQQLGLSRYHIKDYPRAISALEKALDLRAGYPWESAYGIACCYAQLRQREHALSWLERALNMGFRYLDRARADADFESLSDDPRFKELVALVDSRAMSRDEGWRYDLWLLAREIKRIHYNPYRRVAREDFEAYVRTLHERIPTLTECQIVVGLKKLLRMVGDGHTTVTSVGRPMFQQAVAVQFYFFIEGLFVIAVDPKLSDLLGAQVLRFGDHGVDDVMAAIEQVTSHDNDMSLMLFSSYEMRHPALLNGLHLIPDPDQIRLTIRDQTGETRAVTLAADSLAPRIWESIPETWITIPQIAADPLPLYLKNIGANYWFEYQPGPRVLYFQYNRVREDPNEPFEQFCSRLFQFAGKHEFEKFIIDLRWNNGGNTFLTQPLIHGLIRSDNVDQHGKLFVVIGRRTFSAAQNIATFIQRHTKAIFVGEPTGSSPNFVGEDVIVTLPYSEMAVTISDLFWQSSWPMDYRTWIAPRIYTPPSFESYRSNRDPAMEAILAHSEPS